MLKRAGVLIALTLGASAVCAAPSSPMPQVRESATAPSPEERARRTYNSGLEALKKADAFEASAAKESGGKRDKAQKKARAAYENARGRFREVTLATPQLAEAWNSLGYAERKLGSYVAALSAYDQALTQNKRTSIYSRPIARFRISSWAR